MMASTVLRAYETILAYFKMYTFSCLKGTI